MLVKIVCPWSVESSLDHHTDLQLYGPFSSITSYRKGFTYLEIAKRKLAYGDLRRRNSFQVQILSIIVAVVLFCIRTRLTLGNSLGGVQHGIFVSLWPFFWWKCCKCFSLRTISSWQPSEREIHRYVDHTLRTWYIIKYYKLWLSLWGTIELTWDSRDVSMCHAYHIWRFRIKFNCPPWFWHPSLTNSVK